MKTLLTFALLCTSILISEVSAQVVVEIQPVRKEFLVGEAMPMKITISNNSGATLELKGDANSSWLDVHIEKSGSSIPVTQARFAKFPNLKIPAGTSTSRIIELNLFYDISQENAYRTYAIVKLPDRRTIYPSNKALFQVRNGSPIWQQTVQLPDNSRITMSAKMMLLDNKKFLYAQVVNADSGLAINAFALGPFLAFGQPHCVIDGQRNLHILFLSSPTFYTYAIISPKGKKQYSGFYQKIPGVKAQLVPNGGGIFVSGAAYYDPKKEAKPKVKDANASPF